MALVKILKKHDKRSSLSLRSPYLVSVLQQPFYSTEVLSQLIVKVEGRFRKLSAMSGVPAAAATAAGGGVVVAGAGEAGVAAPESTAAVEAAAGRLGGDDAIANGGAGAGAGSSSSAGRVPGAAAGASAEEDGVEDEDGSDSEPSSVSEGYPNEPPGNLARTKAAMEFLDGLKDSDSILRPYGDVPAGRRGSGGESTKRSAEKPAEAAEANSPKKPKC